MDIYLPYFLVQGKWIILYKMKMTKLTIILKNQNIVFSPTRRNLINFQVVFQTNKPSEPLTCILIQKWLSFKNVLDNLR